MRVTTKHDGSKVIAINTRIDMEAYELLQQFSPTKRGHGRFISRLLYEHQVRQEERARTLGLSNVGAGENHAA
jgi:hypothetical protein